MKKFLAMLLVLVMVLPMCFVAQAGEIEPGTKPFYFVNWSSVDQYGLDNAFDIYMLWVRPPAQDADSLFMSAMNWESENTPVGHAEGMYEMFSTYPEGTRYLYIPGNAIDKLHEDWIFLDRGVELTKEYIKELITEYYIIGGELDGVVYDFEYNPPNSYYISQKLVEDPELFNRIVANERYQKEIRPMLVERGFTFWDNVTEKTPEIYSVYTKSDRYSGEFTHAREVWDSVMRDWVNQYLEEAASPVFKYYKDATLSDYRRDDNKSWQKSISQQGGVTGKGGHINSLGGVTNENFYSYRPGYTYFLDKKTNEPTYNKPLGYNNAYFAPNAYNMFNWHMNDYKNMCLSNEEGLMQVWLGCYNYMDPADNAATTSFTPYYTEVILHAGMLNPQPFLGWVTQASANNDYARQIKIISDILHELTRVVGADDRKPILTQHNWNSGFAMSGMYAGGRNVWRITPNIYTGTSVEAFKVEGTTDPTFYIDGQTITFPSGKIIENGSVMDAGFCGYWVEMPTDVSPIVTSDENRYEKYPAFQENYDSYEVGMDYIYAKVNPVASWTIKRGSNSNAVIQADPSDANNKVLALTGTYTLKNVKVTDKISAGDGRAEEQTWEVTITLPEKMADKSEVTLLGVYTGDSFKANDGGIKIADGKVYYENGEGKYVQLDGVDVSGGGKFKVKRLVDLNNAEALVSDYEIYNAEGKLLGAVRDVPFAGGIELPIEGIGVSCIDIEGDPILLDDYKLYASGITTDFELYEKYVGLLITDQEKPTTDEVVARLSWMNATADEKEYAVVAAYYNGETQESEKTVTKIKMAAGTDSVEIIEIPAQEGKAVRVYLKDVTEAKTDDNTGAVKAGLSVGAIIAICAGAAVVLAGAAIGVLLVLKKKKAAVAPAAEDAAFAEISSAVAAETDDENN